MVRLWTVRKRVQQRPISPFSIQVSCSVSQPSRFNGLRTPMTIFRALYAFLSFPLPSPKRASQLRCIRRHGLAPPNPASPARSDLPFAAKLLNPARGLGGPSSFLQSQSLFLSEIDDSKIPDTDPKRVKNTTIFSSKVREESRNSSNASPNDGFGAVTGCLVFPGNFPLSRVNNF
ncbi:hypothetical protein AVEN_2558-1 [Araneus ventricosus]|uniref:Uncharacterized protein n=1 Tax=Araneus ventricosus TaxID=182803 RepID=A0A4Y2GRR8_ARAVE|nr:hypothetical protein AVEN_2558-1 [Araneus ventricosus]